MPLSPPLGSVDGGDALGHPIVSPSKWKWGGDTCHNHQCASEASINTKSVDHPTREGSISKECRSEMWGRVKNRDFSVVTSEHCRILPVRYWYSRPPRCDGQSS